MLHIFHFKQRMTTLIVFQEPVKNKHVDDFILLLDKASHLFPWSLAGLKRKEKQNHQQLQLIKQSQQLQLIKTISTASINQNNLNSFN